MPRIRTIKPEFWTDEYVATHLSRDERLFFIGTWNLCDDYGIFKASPKWIKGQLFPYDDDMDTAKISLFLGVLADKKFIVGFQCVGEDFFIVRKFADHQKMNHPSFKGHISPEKLGEELGLKDLPRNFPEYAGIVTGVLTLGKERKGKEGKGRDSNGKLQKTNQPPLPGIGDAHASPGEKNLKEVYRTIDIKDIKIVAKWIEDHKPTFVEPYVALWNLFAKERKLPEILKINDTRKRKLAIRLREKEFNYLAILRKAAGSEFVISGSWFTFDWLIENEKNYLKVLEGNYKNKDAKNGHEQLTERQGEKLSNAIKQIEGQIKS